MKIEEAKIKSTLKTLMKQQGLQYKDLAKALRVSPATIKRRLNQGEVSISELSEIAANLGTSFYEIIELSKQNTREAYLFTAEQEELFAGDLSYLLLFRAIVMGLSFIQLKQELGLKDVELRKKLRRLEEVKLIELQTKDRIVQLARFPFKWREDGRLQKVYFKKNLQSVFSHISTQFKGSTYNEDTGAICKTFEFLLSQENKKVFARELMEVLKKYQNLSLHELNMKSSTGITVSGILHLDAYTIWKV